MAPAGGVAAHPLVFDIDDWTALDLVIACRRTVAAVREKGFCFINGFAGEGVRRQAAQEARALKRAGQFKRTPEEATQALLGPLNSCWTLELEELDKGAPPGQEGLRAIEGCLEDVGDSLQAGCELHFGEVYGREPACLHYSKMPEDRPAPKLADPEEALRYCVRASQHRLGLYYCLGPSFTVITISPRQGPGTPYTVVTRKPVIVAYRSDACLVGMCSKGVNVTLEVGFLLHPSSGGVRAARDILPIPQVLASWMEDRLDAIAEDDGTTEDIPLGYRREAALRCHREPPFGSSASGTTYRPCRCPVAASRPSRPPSSQVSIP